MFDLDYESGPSRSPARIEHSQMPTLFHPKPVAFQRPAFTSSYSSPAVPTLCSSASSSSSAGSPPSCPLSMSASSSPSPPSDYLKAPNSLSTKHRSKMPKKMSSTVGKHKSVQVSLEVKVERHRGFHAFFVPLARSMPPAPPSSPVFGQSSNTLAREDQADEWQDGSKSEERWVEDVSMGGQRMDIDG